MKLPPRVWIGIGIAGVTAVVVGVLLIMNLSSPRRRTVVVRLEAPNMDDAAVRKEIDRRIADYRAKGEPVVVVDFKPPPIEAKRNAAEPLMAAMKWLDTPEVSKHPVWELEVSPKLTAQQWQVVDDAVQKFAPALALIDQADGRNGADWKIQFKSPAISILLPSLNGARQCQNLLRLAAMSAHRAGRDDEAVHRLAQMVTLTRHLDSGHPALVGHLVAAGLARLATDAVASIVPTLQIARDGAAAKDGSASPQQVDQLIASLLDPRVLEAGWRRVAMAERMFMLDTYQCLADGRIGVNEVFGSPGGTQPAAEAVPPANDLLAEVPAMLDYITSLVSAAQADRIVDFRRQHPAAPATGSLVARNLLPSYDRISVTHYGAVAHLRLAAVALAVRTWSADHDGTMPQSLDDLVPRYLGAVPADPMVAAPATLLYRGSPEPMVYSAGVDPLRRRSAAAGAGGAGAATTTTTAASRDFSIRLVPAR